MDALTEEQLVVDVDIQVIAIVKSFLIYIRWDQVWGTGGHSSDSRGGIDKGVSVSTFGFNRIT
jgi:hypothetical protein